MHSIVTPKPAARRTWVAAGRMLMVCLPLLLCACATTRVVDSEVRSYAGNVVPQPKASFRFDRLLSQQTTQAQEQAFQQRLEAMAATALADIGLSPIDQHAQYTVQVSASVELVARAPVFPGPRLGGFWGSPQPLFGTGMGVGIGMANYMEPPWSRYGVHLLIRDAATNALVFESTAQHIGPWSDAANMLPAVLRAALRDYPQSMPQSRTVRVEVGPQGMSDRP
jgi:uncharacterized protein YjiS (DUF1127 family)